MDILAIQNSGCPCDIFMHVHNVLWSYSHTHTPLPFPISCPSGPIPFSIVPFCCVFVVWECVMRSLACRNVYACACICRGLKGMLCIFLYHSLPHSRERGSLTKSKAHLSTRLASKLPGSSAPPLLSPHGGVTGM